MKRKYKPVLRVLALIMALVCLGVSLAPASFAFAGVLDPAAWLYPIWSMYGAQNGVNVTTTGDADFTIDGMTSLWNEYQASRVSSGLQQVAQTITDFVNGVKGFVSVVAGVVTGGSLNTKLMLGAGIVGALDAFWNWIITDKLGGTSVDSTDFDQSSGNIANVSGSWAAVPVTTNVLSDIQNRGLYIGRINVVNQPLGYIGCNGPQVYTFLSIRDVNQAKYDLVFACLSAGAVGYFATRGVSELGLTFRSGSYYYTYTTTYFAGDLVLPVYDSISSGLSALSEYLGNPVGDGSLTVAPNAGVDVLGFPDSDEVDYVPSDAVIPWNIPYDSTKDTDAYIDAAFADAVSGDLTIGEEGEVVQPVPGVGPVGDYVAVGLGDVFPFCIPFDIYDFVSALAADPVAPSFTAELAFPEVVGGTQYVELDFDTPTFNQLASILRTMELLAFIVGLALLTRSMFIRG